MLGKLPMSELKQTLHHRQGHIQDTAESLSTSFRSTSSPKQTHLEQYEYHAAAVRGAQNSDREYVWFSIFLLPNRI
jgi:hypothetical protein